MKRPPIKFIIQIDEDRLSELIYYWNYYDKPCDLLFRKPKTPGLAAVILTVESDWDIYIKTYTIEEIAARFLRIKGYNVQITISDNTEHPSYQFGYIRFYRYARIKFNSN